MNKGIAFIVLLMVLGTAVYIVNRDESISLPNSSTTSNSLLSKNNSLPPLQVIAENLDTPWGIAFLPDKSLLVTERVGRVRLITADGTLQAQPVAVIQNAKEIGEGGLLGITLHPDFSDNHYVYLYYTYSSTNNNSLNKVVRMTYENNTLSSEQTILQAIPGASNHNGGRIKFGPDGMLYITTGDAQEPSQAQNARSLAGKILRVTDEGKVPGDNPFNNEVYSYGHRNPQGLAWDTAGQLWVTEHGRSGAQSGLDELNKIEKGKNYGWPEIQGDEIREGMETAYLSSGSTTWAPAGLAYIDTSLFFGGLRGKTLYKVSLPESRSTQDFFSGEYGRIREVMAGPDGMLYISTSNQDGRGSPSATDDKIIRINPSSL